MVCHETADPHVSCILYVFLSSQLAGSIRASVSFMQLNLFIRVQHVPIHSSLEQPQMVKPMNRRYFLCATFVPLILSIASDAQSKPRFGRLPRRRRQSNFPIQLPNSSLASDPASSYSLQPKTLIADGPCRGNRIILFHNRTNSQVEGFIQFQIAIKYNKDINGWDKASVDARVLLDPGASSNVNIQIGDNSYTNIANSVGYMFRSAKGKTWKSEMLKIVGTCPDILIDGDKSDVLRVTDVNLDDPDDPVRDPPLPLPFEKNQVDKVGFYHRIDTTVRLEQDGTISVRSTAKSDQPLGFNAELYVRAYDQNNMVNHIYRTWGVNGYQDDARMNTSFQVPDATKISAIHIIHSKK